MAPDKLAGRNTPQQRRSQERRQRILVAASQLYYQYGYDAVTTNLIAEYAGVPIGSVYRYFATKEAILEALSEHYCLAASSLMERVAIRLPTSQMSNQDLTRTLVTTLLQYTGDNRVAGQLLVAEVHPVFMRLGHPIRRIFVSAFEKLLVSRLSPMRDPSIVATLCFDALRSVVWQILLAPPELHGQLMAEVTQLVSRYIS